MASNLLTPAHIAIVLIALVLIVGPKRLPQTGRALGSAIREFKHAIIGSPDNSSDPELEPPAKREQARDAAP